jgi:SAM-dependent methyltransferase
MSTMAAVPDRANAVAGLVARADALRAEGNFDHALMAYAEARRLDPASAAARQGLVSILQMAHTTTPHPGLASLMADCLADPAAYHQALGRSAALQIRLKYDLDRVRDPEGAAGAALVARLETDGFFLDFLARTIVIDAALERFLTTLRRCLLLDPNAGGVVLRAAVAVQCVHNEFAWWAEPDELDVAARLAGALRPEDEKGLATVAMYVPPHELPIAAALAECPAASWSPALRPVVGTVLDRRVEESILGEIESFGESGDPVSRAVAALYEENPYPRWIGPPRPATRGDVVAGLRRKFPHMGAAPNGRPLQVLCAGCGTGRHALSLLATYEGAEITGIDLSRRSLAYAIRRARELGLGAIRFFHGDILEIDRLGRRFDVIESVGVLHHMADPAAGLARLTAALKPGGIVRLGLYGDHRRRDIVEARRRIAALGLDASAGSVRLFRHLLLADPAYRDLAGIADRIDFFSVSGARDLLFHVQEHRFTIPRIRDMLAASDLRFLGFENVGDGGPPLGAGPAIAARYRRAFPNEPTMASLDNWALLEQSEPSLLLGDGFSGYVFWAQRPTP